MTVVLRVRWPDDPLLEQFHRGIYWDAFAAQHEPLEVWKSALAGELPYRLHVDLVIAGGVIAAGIAYERYPQSSCGLVTYMVVAPSHRRSGIGRALLKSAIGELVDGGACAVFGEVNDPRLAGRESEWSRLDRFCRWGARVVDIRYVQPALGEGLSRDRGLVLIAFPPFRQEGVIDGAIVRAFVEELYRVTEGGAPDEAIEIGESCALVQLNGKERA